MLQSLSSFAGVRTSPQHSFGRSCSDHHCRSDGAELNNVWPAAVLFGLIAVVTMFGGICGASEGKSASRGTDHYSRSSLLRLNVVQILAQIDAASDDLLAPLPTRTNIYVNQPGLSRLRLNDVRISVDGLPVGGRRSVSFGLAETVAAYGDWLRVGTVAIEPGQHSVQVTVTLIDANDDAAPSEVLAGNIFFEKTLGESNLGFELRSGLFGGPKLASEVLLAIDQTDSQGTGTAWPWLSRIIGPEKNYRMGDSSDPALSHILNLERSGEPEAALREVLKFGELSPAVAAPEYSLAFARLLRSLDMLDEAELACAVLEENHALPESLALERLRIAEKKISLGKFEAAAALLERAKKGLPELARPDWRHAYARILLEESRPGAAVEAFGRSDQNIEAFRVMNDSIDAQRAAAYSRYNLAVALVRNGDEMRGLSWLDLIGRSSFDDQELKALRDKANLALGWYFLEEKQGRTAMGALARVSFEGAESNSALLAMGWAQLAPAGERLSRVILGTQEYSAPVASDVPAPVKASLLRLGALDRELNGGIASGAFEVDDAPKDRKTALMAALRIWKLLAVRDERDAAVQEGMLALGFAYDELGDATSAGAAYHAAIEALRRVEQEIDSDISFVRSGEFVAEIVGAGDVDAPYETMARLQIKPERQSVHLYAAIDDLRNLHDLNEDLLKGLGKLEGLAMSETSASHDGSRVNALRRRLSLLRKDVIARTDTLAKEIGLGAEEILGERRSLVRKYLLSALLLSAHNHDRPSAGILEDRGCDEPDCESLDQKEQVP